MTLNPEFAFPALWNPYLRTGTMILIVHLVMCELPHLPQFWWSDTLTAGVLMQSRKGGERYRRVWNSPCASKQILILYLHLHQITQLKTRTVELHNSYQECTLGWVSWCRYQPVISWGRTLALTWLHPGIPNDVRRCLGAWCLALFSDSLVIMAIVVGSK